MSQQKIDSDDSSVLDFFPSSPGSQRFTSPPCDDSPSKPRTLPVELIEHIIALFHQKYRSFRALRSLSVANAELRTIVLRRYMTSLEIHSTKQLVSLLNVHTSLQLQHLHTRVGFHWTRSLTADAGALASAPWRPSLMTRLRSLSISFAAEARSTQKMRIQQIVDVPLMNAPMTHLTSLTLTGLWSIDVSLLRSVSRGFPALSSLYLSCTEHLDVSCCWACFEDSSLTVVHSPIPNHFPTVASLTTAFATALKPLVRLAHLHLGILLSDEAMLDRHIDHYDSPRAFSALSPIQNHRFAGSLVDAMLPFPHGPEQCMICATSLAVSDVRTRELEATLALAQTLKSLTTVGWSSFFAEGEGGDEKRGDWQRATKTYVLRRGGRVRVRRRPWE